jgi:hypothetical protein
MRQSPVLLSIFIGLIATDGQAATTSTPQVSFASNQSNLSPDSSFTSGSAGASYSRVDTANNDGGATSIIEGSLESSGTRSAPNGGGTLTWNTSSSLNATWAWGQATSQTSWNYHSSFAFESSLNYQASSVTSGNFFFALNPTNMNALSFDRNVRIEVDRPLNIQLAISSVFSGATKTNFQGVNMMGGPPDFMTALFYADISELSGKDGVTWGSFSLTYGNISYDVSGRGTADGVVYDILASPIADGLSETLELHWFMDYTSKLTKTGVNQLSVDLDNFGSISESLTVTSVPEPTCWLATVLGVVFFSRRRRQAA